MRAATPPQSRNAPHQACDVGVEMPPCGSPMTTNTAVPTQVIPAAVQAMGRIDWWTHTRRRTRPNTSSVTKSVCTTEIRPSWRARAWKTKPAMRNTHPRSHRGLRNK